MLYGRSDGQRAFLILNRLHANNYRQACGEIESVQLEGDLIMFKTLKGKVW